MLYICTAGTVGRGKTTTGTQRHEAHIQATESEACEQARISGTHEDSRRKKGACEEAGPGTRPPGREDRHEIVE